MQNRYSGDIGDFSKLGLLRHLSQTGLSIGLNWYLVPDESHNNDGMHNGYLSDHSFEACDPDLWKALYKGKGIIISSGVLFQIIQKWKV